MEGTNGTVVPLAAGDYEATVDSLPRRAWRS